MKIIIIVLVVVCIGAAIYISYHKDPKGQQYMTRDTSQVNDKPSPFVKQVEYVDPVTKVPGWVAILNHNVEKSNGVLFREDKDSVTEEFFLETYIDEKNGFAFDYPALPRSALKFIEIKISNIVPAEADMPKNGYGIAKSKFGDSFSIEFSKVAHINISDEIEKEGISKSFVQYLIAHSMREAGDASATFLLQQKALYFAERKVMEKYPNMEEHGQKFELIEAVPIKGKEGKWYIKYDLPPTVTDAAVVMIVDINTGEITDYQDDWA